MASYYVTPYFAKQIYDRGSLAELAAAYLCPWVFYHLVMTARSSGNHKALVNHAVCLALCLAATMYTHPIVAIWLAVALVPCAIGAAMDCGRVWTVLTAFSGSAVLGVALSASYWLPAFSLRESVSYQNGLGSVAFANLSLPAIFSFERKLLGPVLPIFAVAGAWCGSKSRFVVAALACCLGFVCYMTGLSLPARHSIAALQYLQMPFRVLSVCAALQLICTAALLGAIEERWKRRVAPLVGMALVAAFAVSQRQQYVVQGPLNFDEFRMAKERVFENMTHTDEFMPKAARIRGLHPRRRDGPIATASDGAVLEVAFNRADIDIGLTVEALGATTVQVNQFYFPGWQVEVDGVSIEQRSRKLFRRAKPAYGLDTNGRLRIWLPQAGRHFVRVRYDGVPSTKTLAVMIAATLAACWGLLFRGRW
jgi:hypothetical protein